MSEGQAPPWLDNEKLTPRPTNDEPSTAGNPNWYPGMKSPNPAGRPRGATAKTILIEKILAEVDGVLDAVLAKALDGDVGAASLILSRVLPGLKAQSASVEFAYDASVSAARQIEQVIAAMSSGAVPPDVAKQIIDAIGALAQVRATEELEARIAALEEVRGAR